MDFNFNMPVELVFGTGIIRNNTGKFKLGQKALVVTGRNSAKLSGALNDVVFALDHEAIEYCIFDNVINNPTMENVAEGTAFGKKNKADFVIAIGGGSPMDAAKAIAALMTNDIDPIDLIGNIPTNKSLPLIAIPTTSGTGSEVTPYSVLTVPSMNTKKSFFSPSSFPVVAFADPSYTKSLTREITLDTAFDAFSHLLESYLSLKSTPLNDVVAIEGIKAFASCMKALADDEVDDRIRSLLMYASCLGGIAITHTGTTLIHAMGYSLTYFKGLSHGRANTMLMGEYLGFNMEHEPEKIQNVLDILGFKSIIEADDFFNLGTDEKPNLTVEEINMYTQLAMGQRNVKLNPRKVIAEDIKGMYQRIFGGAK
ncbi:MAG: iron-containing alcohol dehydrogenase [Clostridia bacterium]|nr:iron-containing alcohol dehydrogenase [Clostridia bacterium]MBN2882140.1 iron-containing alcohol dehydrogenase [Clostridia bacterium]